VGAELFNTDGRTDGRTNIYNKALVAFRDVATAPQNKPKEVNKGAVH
jgi:hypothetical protein